MSACMLLQIFHWRSVCEHTHTPFVTYALSLRCRTMQYFIPSLPSSSPIFRVDELLCIVGCAPTAENWAQAATSPSTARRA
jgi:hypothetical protein